MSERPTSRCAGELARFADQDRPPPRCASHHNPLHCVLPQYLLNQVALGGSELQRRRALATLNATSALTSARVALNESSPAWLEVLTGPRLGLLAAAELGRKNRTIFDAHN